MNDEPITQIAELNDLRMKVLNGEEIPPEKYLEVLLATKKIRRSHGEPASPKAKAAKVDVQSLFAGIGPKGPSGPP